jgi:hypothetical protein
MIYEPLASRKNRKPRSSIGRESQRWPLRLGRPYYVVLYSIGMTARSFGAARAADARLL